VTLYPGGGAFTAGTFDTARPYFWDYWSQRAVAAVSRVLGEPPAREGKRML
jgi:hypothetical protein